ncbi:MAG: motility hub landmark protein FimV [Gammaproteobacteria bacterium]|nr:MAG: motility hub landmark protein FimV [Gammaproteobacteria bacterium]
MFRKSALAMAMLGSLASANVAALGLGEIDLKSALNQPLNAEIELLSATASELEEIKISIGSSEAFANAGIDRPIFLSKLRFNVKTNADGVPVVQVTSRDVVREPFLDFLVELSWSKGRLLREYTVLVDPPVTMPAAAPVPQAPAVQSATPYAPVAAPARRVTHTAQMPPAYSAPGEYGPVRRNDTLWRIAQQVRPDSDVSIEQTMQGLLRANPEAFTGNNINNLKEGYILRVPSREELTSVSRAEAASESRAQYTVWREARGILTPAQSEGTVQAVAPGTSTPVESRLTLVSPETAEGDSSSASAEAGAEMEAMQQDLLMANEALEAQRRQGEDMSERLSVLEEQIVNMQRLIQLKDDELARLQSRAGAETAEATGEAVVEPPADVSTEVPAEMEQQLVAETDPLASVPAAEDAGVSTETEVVAGDETAVIDAAGVETPVDETMEADTVVADAQFGELPPAALDAEPVVTEPVVEHTLTTPPGFVDRLLANPLWLGAGGVVLALLAFFGLRRKRSVETEFQESILQAARGDSAGSDSEIVGSGPDSTESASSESSLLSEFAVSDMGSIKNDGEADPLAEADVYLAYGRYQQAEDLITDALEKDTENENLNLKLLEVYLASKNPSAFDEHAQGILARLEDSDHPMWAKVSEMGRELSPENSMYQAGSEPAVSDLDDNTEMDSLSEDINFDIDNKAVSEPAAGTDQDIAAADDEGLEFDIDLSFDADKDKPDSVEFTPPEADAGQPEATEPQLDVTSDDTLDFDLEGLDMDSEAAQEAEPEGDGELTDLDEVSTKLDLARAYIDMGDPDGAKSILDEVMEEGNDDQQDEARGIMEQMTSSS